MPKSAQKRQNAASANNDSMLVSNDRDYEDGMLQELDNVDEYPLLPITPSKPLLAKKPTLTKTNTDSLKSDEIVNKLASLINTRCDALEGIAEATRAEIKALKEKMGCIEKRVKVSEQNTLACVWLI